MLVFLLIFSCVSILFIDPDFFWHVAVGKIILKSGIPKIDTFSYTMSGYSVIYHEWLIDMVFAFLVKNTNIIFISIITSSIAIISIALHIKWRSELIWIVLLGLSNLLPFIGMRPQVFSWLLFSIVLKIIVNYSKNPANIKFIPLLFFVWANVHASFPLGLLVYVLFIIFNFKKGLSKQKTSLLLLVLSFLVTMLNPYGIKIWREILFTMVDINIRMYIVEWMPALLTPTLSFIPAIALSFTYSFKLNTGWFNKIMFVLLIVMSFSSVRYIPYFIIFSTYIFSYTSGLLIRIAQKNKSQSIYLRINKYLIFISIIVVLLQFFKIILFNPHTRGIFSYPKKAYEYIKKHPPKGNVFSEYSWGGYQILYLPQKKVFIDGRMASWRSDEKAVTYPLVAYKNIMLAEKNYYQSIKKLNIRTIILPKQYYNDTNLIKKLVQRAWKITYSDKSTIIVQLVEK